MKQRSFRSRLARRVLYAILVTIVAFCCWYVWPEELVKPGLSISKETTFFTAPVDDEGYVNYQVALNEYLQKGVTVENNAMVLLLQAIGPKPEGGHLPPEYFQRLGAPEPTEQGDYLVKLEAFAKGKEWPELVSIDTVDEWHATVGKRAWKSEAFPHVAEWIELNVKPLLLVEQASRRTHYYSPMVFSASANPHEQSLMALLVPYIQTCRVAGNMLVIRALQRIGLKQYLLAWNDLLTTMRLGRVVAQGGTLIELLIGLDLQNQAYEACIAMLEMPEIPLPFLKQCVVELGQLPALPTMDDKVNVGERCMALDTFLLFNRLGPGVLDVLGGGKISKSTNYAINSLRKVDWSPSLIKLNNWFDEWVSIHSEKDRIVRQAHYQLKHVELLQRKTRLAEESASIWRFFDSATNRVDRYVEAIMVLLLPALPKVELAYEKTIQRGSQVQIAFALAIFHREQLRYPEKLDELIPVYLAAIPPDLFSGNPVLYQKTEQGYFMSSLQSDVVTQIPLPPFPPKSDE